jgi:hypothetical protein
MAMVEFVGQSARDADNIRANPSRLVNLYREPVDPGDKHALKSVLGTTAFADLGGVFVRAMAEVEGDIYALANLKLQKIDTGGSVTDLGVTLDDANASIAGNNGNVTAVIGGAYYLWDGATLTNPVAGAFSSFGAVEYIGNYTVLTELNGRRFQWSGVADPNDLPGLSFSTADGRDDDIIRPLALNGQLYLLKAGSIEEWYLTGEAGALAFERRVGGVTDIGLKSFGLVARFDGGAFLVGDDNRAHMLSGQLQPVSTPAVETAIKTCDPQYCLTYDDEGHTFCVITFRDCPAWVFDVATGEWHERAQGAGLSPWQVSASARMANEWYVGRDGGAILHMERSNADEGLPLVRMARSRVLYMDGSRFVVPEVEIFPRVGFDAATVELSLSRDGGITWGSPKAASWSVGDYSRRVIWRNLGQFRQAALEVRMSDPVDVPLSSQARVKI